MKSSKKIVTFGELLLRLASPGYTRLFQTGEFEASFCGGEANVAVSLALFGQNVSFVSKLPDNDVGVSAVQTLRSFGVDVTKISFGEGRMGLYYLEKGASQRPSKVIYDRQFSAMALAKPADFHWDAIFSDCDWFHWTGITPALSEDLALICLDACQAAKKRGIPISCDLNYRSKLWDRKTAQSVMLKLMPYVDVCIGNEEDAEVMLGIPVPEVDVDRGIISEEGLKRVAEEIGKRFGCGRVAFSLRRSYSASRNGWQGMLYDCATGHVYLSDAYDIQIVDRVGGGDSFSAGLIYGLICKKDLQAVLDFAVAASCLKHTIEGDFNRTSVRDVELLLHTRGSGRVLR